MQEGFYCQPFQYAAYQETALCIKKTYPFLDVFSLGKSLLGRELYGFTIGPSNDTVLFLGGVHGMEWLTSLLLMRFLEDLCHCLSTGEPLAELDIVHCFKHRSVTFVPCLNPDGIEISLGGPEKAGPWSALVSNFCWSQWQANARGIDLNHNFDAGHELLQKMERLAGFVEPGPTRYGGAVPCSEPETQALTSFCKMHPPKQALAFHSQGEEIYYHYGPRTPRQSKIMAHLLANSSGYRVSHPEGLASHGGFKDWFIDYFGSPAFTIEIGRGENPLPLAELEPIYGRLLEMMLISILL